VVNCGHNASYKMTIRNMSKETLSNVNWANLNFLCFDDNDKLESCGCFIDNYDYSSDLSIESGGAITGNCITLHENIKYMIVVYSGQLGNERDAVIGKFVTGWEQPSTEPCLCPDCNIY